MSPNTHKRIRQLESDVDELQTDIANILDMLKLVNGDISKLESTVSKIVRRI